MHLGIIKHKDKLYVIKRTLKETTLKPELDLTFLKQAYHSDLVLKKDGLYFFVEEIQEPEIIND